MSDSELNSDNSQMFFPNWNFSKHSVSPSPFDNDANPKDFSPFPLDLRSPLPTLNFSTSPKFRKADDPRTTNDNIYHKESLSSNYDIKFKLKPNPRINKNRDESDRKRGLCLGFTFNHSNPVKETSVFEFEENIKSMCFVNESTVNESQIKEERRNPQPVDIRFHELTEFESASSDGLESDTPRQSKHSNEFGVKKLLKMEPLYKLFVGHYNEKNWKPNVNLEHDYELKILKALLRILGHKNCDTLVENQFTLISYLSLKPKIRKSKLDLMKSLFKKVYKCLWEKFAYSADASTREEINSLFLNHYFLESAGNQEALKDFDLTLNPTIKRLDCKDIRRFFNARLFKKDFESFVNEGLSRCLQVHRSRKLYQIFLKWENYFLESKCEDDALSKVVRDIRKARFSWVIHDESYLRAFEAYSSK